MPSTIQFNTPFIMVNSVSMALDFLGHGIASATLCFYLFCISHDNLSSTCCQSLQRQQFPKMTPRFEWSRHEETAGSNMTTTFCSIYRIMDTWVYAFMGNRDIPGVSFLFLFFFVFFDLAWFLGFWFLLAWIECPVFFPLNPSLSLQRLLRS
ncbi:hypothetical protein F5Y03DRAFT_143460 [Xylaria venustula]|nr:hypothetical protein F5Y03DRAFT_143460 [Xylaria venustula]